MEYSSVTPHCEFLEYWNTQKVFWGFDNFFMPTWWRDSKIWKKLNPHDGFLSYLQNGTANSAHLASHFCPCLSLPSKSHRENSISCIFLESLHQVGMKNVVKFYKHFFGYFSVLKTHGETLQYFLKKATFITNKQILYHINSSKIKRETIAVQFL